MKLYRILPVLLILYALKINQYAQSNRLELIKHEQIKENGDSSADHLYDYSANKSEKSLAKCMRPDIEQFPRLFFSQWARNHGAVIFHFVLTIYMFIGLAIVCDDYFVPSLELICKLFHLKEDVAGYYLSF